MKDLVRSRGFTLIEVLVALAVMGMVAVLTAQSFHTANKSSEALLENMKRMAEVDRAFFSIESDLKYAIDQLFQDRFRQPLPPFTVDVGDNYWMTLVRGSVANSLYQARSEQVRVGYRYIEDQLWRDTWINPTEIEEEDARPRRILTGVENLSVRLLTNKATSLTAGPWEQSWPNSRDTKCLPKAIEITIELEDLGEITRLYAILEGLPMGGASGGGRSKCVRS